MSEVVEDMDTGYGFIGGETNRVIMAILDEHPYELNEADKAILEGALRFLTSAKLGIQEVDELIARKMFIVTELSEQLKLGELCVRIIKDISKVTTSGGALKKLNMMMRVTMTLLADQTVVPLTKRKELKFTCFFFLTLAKRSEVKNYERMMRESHDPDADDE